MPYQQMQQNPLGYPQGQNPHYQQQIQPRSTGANIGQSVRYISPSGQQQKGNSGPPISFHAQQNHPQYTQPKKPEVYGGNLSQAQIDLYKQEL